MAMDSGYDGTLLLFCLPLFVEYLAEIRLIK